MPIRRSTTVALVLLAGTACVPSAHVHPRAAEEVARGYRYLRDGDAERAEIAFDHALEFNGDFPEALNGLGIVARRSGELERARRHFEQAIHVAPYFAEAHSNLGEIWLTLGDRARAEAEMRAALAIDPDLLDARLNLARMLLHGGRGDPAARNALWAEARREYLHLVEAFPDLAEAHHDLGFIAFSWGDFAEAERDYRRAVELAPASVEALHGLCISLVRLGRCDEAAVQCRRCLHIDSRSPACEKSLAGALACSAAGGA